ncbi:MAG: DUF1501 domain-containing protein [Actinobacteria bacterium]|nr:DUF1501 domain-containing protein [Actinomycetota bacterium]
MPEMNRRQFLIAGAGVGAAGLLAGVAGCTLNDLPLGESDAKLDDGAGVLVIVTLYGGNDGLSTVIPATDSAYHDARPDLAYAPEDVLPLDAQLGLNPAMTGFSQLWADRNLAIVRGVTYPKPDRSHFKSMDIWQTASPDAPVYTGWLGRWLDATGEDPLRAINIGAVLPLMAVGEKQTASALSGDSSPVSNQVSESLTALGASDPNDTRAMSAVCTAYRSTSRFGDVIGPVLGTGEPTVSIDPLAGGLTFKAASADAPNPLTSQLNVVSKCVKAGLPTRVYMVALGGFDTHADERQTQQDLLAVLDRGLTPFLRDMSADRYGKNVVVMVYSEFGRRVVANASFGTDHGTAGPVFLAGTPVKGGFYGEEPSLTDLDDGDLKGGIDFRDIYHELLTKTVGTDPEPSLGSGRSDLGFL